MSDWVKTPSGWKQSGGNGVSKAEVNEIKESLNQKQNKSDDTLTTDDKTVVGGINELKQDLQTLENSITDSGVSYTETGIATCGIGTFRQYGSYLTNGIKVVNLRLVGSGSLSVAGTSGTIATITDAHFIPQKSIFLWGSMSEGGTDRVGMPFRINPNGTINQLFTSRTISVTSFEIMGTYIV